MSDARLFSMGLLTKLPDPKLAPLYAAPLPQFVDARAGRARTRLLPLGVFALRTTLSDTPAPDAARPGSLAGGVERMVKR
ncbi:hypothetical protein [Streptomyces cremeus]|uniref:Uncharacterized protein n=1 Tax=Streptomyces cremeus TaxID=66881 RepID=A0ABV5PIJ5_STRCM